MHRFLSTVPFDLYELALFHLVVKHRSFTKAAEIAGLTQSAITRQMQGVENSLGIQLLERTTRNIRVTPAGEFLYREAARLLGDVDQSLNHLAQEFAEFRRGLRAHGGGRDRARQIEPLHREIVQRFGVDCPRGGNRADSGRRGGHRRYPRQERAPRPRAWPSAGPRPKLRGFRYPPRLIRRRSAGWRAIRPAAPACSGAIRASDRAGAI